MWAEPAGWGQNTLIEVKMQGGGRRGPHGERRALPHSQKVLSAQEAWHSASRNTGAPSLSSSQPDQNAKGSRLSDGLEASIPKPAVLRGFLCPDHTWRITGRPEVGPDTRLPSVMFWGFPGGSAGKESACKAENITEALEKVLDWGEKGREPGALRRDSTVAVTRLW